MRYQTDTVSTAIDYSEVVAALSYALDITEGQPAGHAGRSCMIGMRIATELGLCAEDQSALFYGLLLKDLGCSSNASKVCYLFGSDDRATKADLKTTNWTSLGASMKYVARNVAPGASMLRKATQFIKVATGGQRVARELVQMRCDRGATIARNLHLPEATALAIRSLDEHWDGSGHPDGLEGDQIPLLARVMGLAQTAEVFWQKGGHEAACQIAVDRKGTWFDPALVEVLSSLRADEHFWTTLKTTDIAAAVTRLEPQGMQKAADDEALDRLAAGFGQVIDAKSPWTFCHSTGVAEVAVGIARTLGLDARRVQNLRRAALLHDIGKLGVSNLILDKPGKLDPEELAQMRRHPQFTGEILRRVKGFSEFAELAASHHERLDGRGYHRGISGSDLGLEVRILAVADMYEALAAKRPYRKDLERAEVLTILDREAGVGLCPVVVAGVKTWVRESDFVPYQIPVAA